MPRVYSEIMVIFGSNVEYLALLRLPVGIETYNLRKLRVKLVKTLIFVLV